MTKVSYERNGQTYAIDTANMGEAGIAYLLQYGFSQSLQDSIAGRAKAVREEMLARPDDAGADWTPPTEAMITAAVDADLHGTLGKRMDAILNGTVAVRGPSEAKDPAAGIVRELLVAWAKSKGGKLPKADSDEYKALAAKMRAAKAEYITTELARRAEAVAELDIEL